MRKEYITPSAEIEKFNISIDVCTVSQTEGFGDGNEGTTMPDEF